MPQRIPAEVVFNPEWWFRNYRISFDESFYFDRALRIGNDVRMRQAMYERFRLGEPNPQPRPIVGSEHVAGGFVLPALFGSKIRFEPNAAPCAIPRNLSDQEVLALTVPDFHALWPMDRLIEDMDSLENEFGYVCRDFDLDREPGTHEIALHSLSKAWHSSGWVSCIHPKCRQEKMKELLNKVILVRQREWITSMTSIRTGSSVSQNLILAKRAPQHGQAGKTFV